MIDNQEGSFDRTLPLDRRTIHPSLSTTKGLRGSSGMSTWGLERHDRAHWSSHGNHGPRKPSSPSSVFGTYINPLVSNTVSGNVLVSRGKMKSWSPEFRSHTMMVSSEPDTSCVVSEEKDTARKAFIDWYVRCGEFGCLNGAKRSAPPRMFQTQMVLLADADATKDPSVEKAMESMSGRGSPAC